MPCDALDARPRNLHWGVPAKDWMLAARTGFLSKALRTAWPQRLPPSSTRAMSSEVAAAQAAAAGGDT